MQQGTANGSNVGHKAKVGSPRSLRKLRPNPATLGKPLQRRLTFLFPPVNRRLLVRVRVQPEEPKSLKRSQKDFGSILLALNSLARLLARSFRATRAFGAVNRVLRATRHLATISRLGCNVGESSPRSQPYRLSSRQLGSLSCFDRDTRYLPATRLNTSLMGVSLPLGSIATTSMVMVLPSASIRLTPLVLIWPFTFAMTLTA